MQESLTISKKLPALTSMQYEALRELGIKHIQELAGRLWTNYNNHDPGITMLEVMSYVITDLGYRVNNDIRDILAQDSNDPDFRDIKNFFTACQILPSCPVTTNDFRKLMIDVEVADKADEGCSYAGVKNAWIQQSPDAEQKIYVNHKKSELSLNEVPLVSEQDYYYVKGLYDILLEFDKCDKYGDLNANTIENDLIIYEHDQDPNMVGVTFNVKIEFPRWDDKNVNWENPSNIQDNINNITVNSYHLPDNYELEAFPSNMNEVLLKGNKEIGGVVSDIAELWLITDAVNNFIYDPTEGLQQLYIQKVRKIQQIVAKVRGALHANRNLCHDYYRFNALKIEEIILCTDIDVDPAADVGQVQAQIYHEIAKFLSPPVTFYTLDEMLNKCLQANRYSITVVRSAKKIFTIDQKIIEGLNRDDTISVLGSGENDGAYTVQCISENNDNPDHTDIQVAEEIPSDDFKEKAYLFKGTIDDTLCLTVDKVFEGPKLKHGFIDDKELNASDRLKVIHISDLIKIIMDVDGVLAVKHIQIANRPQDNKEGIESKSVKWCLELATEQNYVPRLNFEASKITFFKDQLPYQADREEVQDIIDSLEKSERSQKIRYPAMDIPVPRGEFMDLEKYTSLQEDFPPVYGVSSVGIPGLNSLPDEERTIRKTEARQLKGFLLFFDQLMANYLSQLAHVKDLFSMNGEKDEFGEYLIDKTYFSQPLYNVIPEADPLYIDKPGHQTILQQIVENQELYEERRNKFLDHLLGRFAETFIDYALLSYKISGAKAPAELIEDKLKFLNSYPDLSKRRGKGFNYLEYCKNWYVDNISGLEKRVSLLTGIDEWTVEKLVFRENFEIVPPAIEGEQFKLQISDDTSNVLLVADPFESELDAHERTELIILNGICKENYEIVAGEGADFYINLVCDDQLLATSFKTDYSSEAPDGDADLAIDEIIGVLEREFYTNPESNRKNLTCPLLNYFVYEVTADMTPVDPEPPTFTITYTLYSQAFSTDLNHALLEGSVTNEATLGNSEAQVLAKGEAAAHNALWDVINNGISRSQYIFDPDGIPYTSPYSFIICNRQGNQIAKSIAYDFHDMIADEAASLSSGEISVAGSTANDGSYTVTNARAEGPLVIIEVDPAPLSPVFDGELSWTESFGITSIDLGNRIFQISTDVADKLDKGGKIKILSSESIDGEYTILSLVSEGSGTLIQVKEPILAADTTGQLTYTKTFEIIEISGSAFTIKGGQDERAITDMMGFIEEKFFSHEGMHIIEHVLLRPRINEKLFVEATEGTITEALTDLGTLFFHKVIPVVSASATESSFRVGGDISHEIVTDRIRIEGGSFNDGTYKIGEIAVDGSQTVITTKQSETPVLFNVPEAPYPDGELIYIKKAPILAIEESNYKIVIADIDALDLVEGDVIQIKGSTEGLNDRRYKVLSVADDSGNVEIIIREVEQLVQDALLPVHLDQECETCKQKDPYSHIASVVLPYWPGRFINFDFRRFMDKTLRLEAPAHILFNICWIDCQQMQEFEKKYKTWLVETGKETADKVKLSQALADFINALTSIRNVYPTGTLHDCEENDTLEGAIILNNSVLGTF